MDFRQFEYLVALADFRNFTIAADCLFVTRNALVYFLSKLEAEIGTELFYRTKSGLVPTRIGEIYIEMANAILNNRRKYQQNISLEFDTMRSKLRVDSIQSFANALVPHISIEFQKIYPNTFVENLTHIESEQFIQSIMCGNVDLALPSLIDDILKKTYNDYIEFSNPLSVPILFVVPKDFPLPEDIRKDPTKPVDIRRFYNETFFVPFYGSALSSFLGQIGLPPKFRHTPTTHATFEFIKCGCGVGFVSPISIADKNAVRCFAIDPAVNIEYHVIYRKNAVLTKPMRTFIKLREQLWEEMYGWSNAFQQYN